MGGIYVASLNVRVSVQCTIFLSILIGRTSNHQSRILHQRNLYNLQIYFFLYFWNEKFLRNYRQNKKLLSFTNLIR